MRRLIFVLALVAACKGADGATGPQGAPGPAGPPGATGPQGPAGPSGSLNRLDGSGFIGSSGGTSMSLPSAAVAGGKLPVVACWISSDGVTWLQVSQTPSSSTVPFCGLTGIPNTPSVTLVNVISGYRYWIVAVW